MAGSIFVIEEKCKPEGFRPIRSTKEAILMTQPNPRRSGTSAERRLFPLRKMAALLRGVAVNPSMKSHRSFVLSCARAIHILGEQIETTPMKIIHAHLLLLTAAMLSCPLLIAQEAAPAAAAATPRSYPERLQWWANARIGMFIHWGPVSLQGTEISWSRANTNPKCPNRGPIPAEVYDHLYREFNPTNFDAADQWQACYRGENPGAKLVARFKPVTAQRVRLNLTEATDGPTVWEFQFFAP